MSYSLSLGSYVKFNNKPYIAIANDGKGKVKVLDVFSNSKKVVNRSNIEVMQYACTRVEHNNSSYLVTNKGYIISLTSNRVMKWDNNNGNRKAIIAKAIA